MIVTRHKLTSKAAIVEKSLRMSVQPDEGVWLYLPFPISANRLNRAVNGHVILSERYRLWRKLVAQELKLQKARRFVGPVHLVIVLRAPDKRKRDGDNATKSLFDALKDYGVIEDDANHIVRRYSVEWQEGAGHPCVIHITPASGG